MQKELQYKRRKTSTPLHSREPVEQLRFSLLTRKSDSQECLFTHRSGEDRTMQVTGPITSSRRTKDGYVWKNILIAIHTELRHTCRLLCQSGPKESERCRRRNSVPKRDARTKRSAASRIESITLSTGRPVADPQLRMTCHSGYRSGWYQKLMKDFMGVPPLEAQKKIKLESKWISSLTRVVVNHTEKEEVDERDIHQQQRSVQACDCLCKGH